MQSGTVDRNVWDAVKEEEDFSEFVAYMEEYELDSIFERDGVYTLFIPDNEAIAEYVSHDSMSNLTLAYHIISHLIQSKNIEKKRKVQTITEKFAFFERKGSISYFDEIEASNESPLYQNGKFYRLTAVAKPLPILFRYFAEECPPLKRYIESLDSIIVDKEESKPIGFDDDGNIIYDTVPIVYNRFEEEIFPVREEYRNKTATAVFPRIESYNNALDLMAQNLGGNFTDHSSIPVEWEDDVLIPFLLERGMFSNIREPEEFYRPTPLDTVRLKNILGDSVNIFYTPVNRVLCSNGVAYDYENFEVPDSLYSGETVFEAEWLLEETGTNKWDWYDEVLVSSSVSFAPRKDFLKTASNDTIISVLFPSEYDGSFNLEYNSTAVFPRKYRLVVSTHMDYGGIYNIYVNDELVKTFDYHDYIEYTNPRTGITILPSVTGKREDSFINQGRWNKFDFWVENINKYKKLRMRFEYVGPSDVPNNGLFLDNIVFIPAE